MDTNNLNEQKLEELIDRIIEKKLNKPQAEKPAEAAENDTAKPESAPVQPEQKPEIKEEKPAAADTEKENKKVKKPSRSYTASDIVFAWFSLLSGYLLCRVFPALFNTSGATAFIVALFGFTAVFLTVSKRKPGILPTLTAVSAVAISFSLIISSNDFINFFAYAYALMAYCYFVYASVGKDIKSSFSGQFILDWLKAILFMPVSSIKKIDMLKAITYGKTQKSVKVLIRIGIGIAVAIIPTVTVMLLLNYEDAFTKIFDRIFDFDIETVMSHIASIIFGIPIGIYLYGIYISSVDNKQIAFISDENCKKLEQKIQIAPTVTMLAAVIPLLAVYVIFFISQWHYYVSGFTGKLPENFSYAEYAREGFFQLCVVSAINLAVITAVIVLTKKGRFHSVIMKTLTVIFSVFTLILISTALSKIAMYIKYYGLTQKRVYATWFMVVLALVFLTVTLSRFIPKIKAPAVSAAILVVAFAALSLCNADRLIAKYNVDRYLDGTHENIDIDALWELEFAAVPEMVRLAKHFDEEQGTNIAHPKQLYSPENVTYYNLRDALVSNTRNIVFIEDNIFNYSINRKKAVEALKDIGLYEQYKPNASVE